MVNNIEIMVLLVSLMAPMVSMVSNKEPPNMEELENSENWAEVSEEICKKDHSDEVKAKIAKCNELDSYFKFDNLTKQCDKQRSHPGSTYYDEEKGECHYQECYKKLSQTQEFKDLSKQLDSLSEENKVKKAFERYKCIRKAMGLKV